MYACNIYSCSTLLFVSYIILITIIQIYLSMSTTGVCISYCNCNKYTQGMWNRWTQQNLDIPPWFPCCIAFCFSLLPTFWPKDFLIFVSIIIVSAYIQLLFCLNLRFGYVHNIPKFLLIRYTHRHVSIYIYIYT